MKIEIVTSSVKRRIVIDLVTTFLTKELKLENSTYGLTIYNAPGLRKREGNNGMVAKTGDREMQMFVDGGLNECDLILCLAHEMVHVKQIAKGQLSLSKRNKNLWFGQRILKEYHERPWEQEAFARERLLATRAMIYVEKQMVKRIDKLVKNA